MPGIAKTQRTSGLGQFGKRARELPAERDQFEGNRPSAPQGRRIQVVCFDAPHAWPSNEMFALIGEGEPFTLLNDIDLPPSWAGQLHRTS